MTVLEKLILEVKQKMQNHDPAHDFEHIMRVYENAKKICRKENVNNKLVLSAVLLHDLVSYPKTDKRSKNASQKSATDAKKILKRLNYSSDEIKIVYDAILNHSFSQKKIPKTLEGKILQDADRLDAIGAIGIARTFSVGSLGKRPFYNNEDPFCSNRIPNDQKWTLDHFFKKLLLLEAKMNTKSAQIEAKRRTRILKKFLSDLRQEI